MATIRGPLSDLPAAFKCSLSGDIMTNPVRSLQAQRGILRRKDVPCYILGFALACHLLRMILATRPGTWNRHMQVILVETDVTYQRRAIEDWFSR